MAKQIVLIILPIFFIPQLFAQINQGARLTAMGINGTSVHDVWGVAANPATISKIRSSVVQLTHQEHYFSKTIKNQALALVLPSKKFVLGFNVQRYGIVSFQNSRAGMVITKSFGPNLAIGIRANYHQLKISDYGSTRGISFDLGTSYQLTDEIGLGIYIDNFSKESYATKLVHTSLPTAAYFGMAYRANKKLLMATSISKERISSGIDYQLLEDFSIRTGLSLHPFTHYFGLGFNPLRFVIDFACIKHTNFGYSPLLTIGYVF